MTRAPLLAALCLVGCAPFEEPSGVPTLPASIVATIPADQDDEVPGTVDITITWDRVPSGVTMRLQNFGQDVAGTVEGDPLSVRRRYVLAEPLRPSSNYTLDVAWSTGEHRISFHTSLLGFPLDEDELDLLLGQTFFFEPGTLFALPEGLPRVGGGPDLGFLLAVHERSAIEDGEAHLMLARTVPASPLQDQCAETAVVTAGGDGVLGTGDDRPGTFENPRLRAAGAAFTAGSSGDLPTVDLPLRDWELDATVLPEEEGLYVHRFAALLDTSGLDALIPESEAIPEGSTFCSLYARFGGGACVPCPSLSRESRCLPLEARDVLGAARRTNARERSCADIIGSAHTGIICDGEDARYDADGDGVYELCPEYEEQAAR